MKTVADICELYKVEQPRALVVDDDRMFLELFCQMLQSHGFSFECCHTASEAIQRAQSEEFHVAFVDIYLRGSKDGIEVMKSLRAIKPSLPIVVMSGVEPVATIAKAISDCGMVVFAEKAQPFPEALLEQVRRWFGLQRCSKSQPEEKP